MTAPRTLPTLLVVDDSDDDYEILLRTFNKENHVALKTFRCENGQQTLDYLLYEGKFKGANHLLPNIILLDLNMPGMTGQSVLEKIKQHDKLKAIPVVIFTTSDNEEDISNCYRLGASTYLQKPGDLTRFSETIGQLKKYWFETALLPEQL
jgi:CheY-like chemotaxis protein